VAAALIAAPAAAPIAPALGQTTNTCLSVENTRSRQTSVAVVGFNETSAYWTFGAGESAVLVNESGPLRGSTFTIRLYDGDGIDANR
jgi:hypothetical protein